VQSSICFFYVYWILLGYRGIMDHNPRRRIMRRAVQLRCAVGWDVEFQWSWPLSPQQLLTLEDWKLAIFGFRSEEVYDGICIILSHCILLSFIFFYSSIVSTQYNFITCWSIYVAYIIIIYCNNLYPTIGYYWMMSFTNSHFLLYVCCSRSV
jgi:hypothetical protein